MIDDAERARRDAWRAAAEGGDIEAQYKMWTVSRDTAEGVRWLRSAADREHVEAQETLATILLARGAATDIAESLTWYRRAAEGGDRRAAWRLCRMYGEGITVERDDVEAMRWLKKAATLRKGGKAQQRLGHMHEHGIGTAVDLIEAYKWYDLAVTSGFREIFDELDLQAVRADRLRVERNLTEAQVMEATDRCRALRLQLISAQSDSLTEGSRPKPVGILRRTIGRLVDMMRRR